MSSSSVNFAHCVRTNRHTLSSSAVCAFVCTSVFGVRSVDCLRVGVRGRGSVSLTWWQRAGGQGCKHCRRRSPGECRPERKRGTQREGGTLS